MIPIESKTAIVTGVTGQMGSYIVEFLLAKGLKVVGTMRRLSVKNHRNIEHITDPNFTLAPMDLCDSHSINALVEAYRPAYFINCAANSFVGSSWDYPEQHMEYNALGVLRQLEAIKRFSPTTKYLNFGSSEEFGDVAYSPQDELHPGRARSPYGASKIAARQIVKVYRESFNLYALQCWCLNYESPRRGAEFVSRKVTLGVARICRAIEDGKSFEPIELGNLNAARDWSHALDFIEGIWLMLHQEDYREDLRTACLRILNGDKPEKWREYAVKHLSEYVLASGQTQTVRVFVEKAFTEAEVVGHWEGVGADETYVRDVCTHGYEGGEDLVRINPAFYRPADVEHLHRTPAKIKAELGWQPKWSFDDLVRDMVKHDLAAVGL